MRAERDIALCAIADVETKTRVMNKLIQKRVPYAEEWDKVPLLHRRQFEGAKEVCVIITHGDKAQEAREIIEGLGDGISGKVYFDLKGIV